MAEVFYKQGDWQTVAKAVNLVFGESGFTLLAEDGDALTKPYFQPVSQLKESMRMPRGRAFDQDREVRWRELRKGAFVINYLSENAPPPAALSFIKSDAAFSTSSAQQKLYGQWNDKMNDWIEVAVPGISGYYKNFVSTMPPPESLKLEVVHYLKDNGIQLTRFCSVENTDTH